MMNEEDESSFRCHSSETAASVIYQHHCWFNGFFFFASYVFIYFLKCVIL